jgi:hypothetical protein
VEAASAQELIGRLINDASTLLDKQIELAKQEVREDLGEYLGAAKTLGIGAGILAACGLLMLIWAWTGVIWFFNWLGWVSPLHADWIGWIVGLVVPAVLAYLGFKLYIMAGIKKVQKAPLKRTRATLKEDLEWARTLRKPSER